MARRGGFTLVELLIASLIGLLVASMAALALHAGFAAWTRIATGGRETLEAVRLLSQLERDVASAFATAEHPFDGASDRLRVVRLRPASDSASPAAPVLIEWRFDAQAETVVRQERPLAASDTTPPQILSFAPVRSFRLDYHVSDAALPAGAPAWETAWAPPVRTNLPMAVRVILGATERVMPCVLQAAATPEGGGARDTELSAGSPSAREGGTR